MINRILNTIFYKENIKKNSLLKILDCFFISLISYINTTIEKKIKNFNNNKFNYENKLHEAENKNQINKTCFI